MTTNLSLREAVALEVMGVRIRHQRVKATRSDLVIPGGTDRNDWYDPDRRFTVRDLIAVVPAYESDIGAAWEVILKIRSLDLGWMLVAPQIPSRWVAYQSTSCADEDFGEWHAGGKTAPEAICRAALAAVRLGVSPA